ncbi:MAG TPA: hypothetical protein VGM65_02850 [Candidatus Udaeobacter sp.]|jgi:hypothetical protein
MQEKALFLTADYPSADDHRAERLLDFFGVGYLKQRASEFALPENEFAEGYRLVCSAQAFGRVMGDLQNSRNSNSLARQIHSVFLYSNGDPVAVANAISQLMGVTISIHRGAGRVTHWHIAKDPDGMCGAMRDLRIQSPVGQLLSVDFFHVDGGSVTPLITGEDKPAFLKVSWNGVPVFVSSERLIDIDAELTTFNFDIRNHFFSAVPVVSYIKWAFPCSSWHAPEASASLIIDDPLLKPTHGFVDFQELLSLMKRHNFSTNIAFIPWNWRRSAPEVVRLFKENPECYSLSVHGCDHTRAEFGSSSHQRLYWKSLQALERMNRHKSITGISHDRVMVFPQGIFSEAAMSALKRTDLIASVNNDIISADPHPRTIKISDVWNIAVMCYPFPLFTRRYPWEGIENFAFDALLGKPAITVIHHDYCSDHCVRLVNFIDQLNSLPCAPTWRNLGEVVRRSYGQREVSPGTMEVEMYGTELRIKNRSGQSKRFLIRRRECEPSAIQRICTDAQEITWRRSNGRIDFEIELNPGENQVIKIKFHDLAGKERKGDNLPYRLKTMLRRYLCEMRDNYLATAKARMVSFSRS